MSKYPKKPGWRDPTTSRDSADAIDEHAAAVRAQVIGLLRRRESTVHEAAAELGVSIPTVQPRFSELRQERLIEPTGERRINAASGHRAHVWRLIPSYRRPEAAALVQAELFPGR